METVPLELTFILAKQGNEKALAELYVAVKPLLFNRVRFYTKSDDLAEDIVSDVMCIMIANIQTLDTNNINAFKKWLNVVAYNKAMDYLSKARATDPLDKSNPISLDDPALTVEIAERNTVIHQAVRKLPTDAHKIIIGRIVHGTPVRQVAQAVGKSPDAARQITLRGLAKLRRILTPLLTIIFIGAMLIIGGALAIFFTSRATPQSQTNPVHQSVSPRYRPQATPLDAPIFEPVPTVAPLPSPTPSPTPTPTPSPEPVQSQPNTSTAPTQNTSQTEPTHQTMLCATPLVCVKKPLQ